MLDNVIINGWPLILSTPAEVDEAEAELGVCFPDGLP
jgi:hypothetical protein